MKNVLLLYVDKKSMLNEQEYKNFGHEVGESSDDLMFFIFKKYNCKFGDLIKNENDDFPYFTNGGFKYKLKTDIWEYTFTAFVKPLLSY